MLKSVQSIFHMFNFSCFFFFFELMSHFQFPSHDHGDLSSDWSADVYMTNLSSGSCSAGWTSVIRRPITSLKKKKRMLHVTQKKKEAVYIF